MNELHDFERIRELVDSYYQQRISKDEYRNDRSLILNKIDLEFNEVEPQERLVESGISLVDKLKSLFKSTDDEKFL